MAYLSSMRLRIDGSEVSWDPSALPTFGEVVEEAGKRAAAGGRIISRVVVEGREISTRLEREIADRPPGGLGEVQITTTTPRELMREALDGALDLSTAILRDVRSVASSIRSGDVPAAKSLYASCVESMATFVHLAAAVFNGTRSGAFSLAEISPGGELPSPPSSTAEILQRLLSAQKAEDWVSMAALLEEEIVPNLRSWSSFFTAMRRSGAR